MVWKDHVADAFNPALSSQSTRQNHARMQPFPIAKPVYPAFFSKWDDLNADEEEDGVEYKPDIPVDMKYIPRNVQRQHANFLSIREVAGKELTNDIYVREPNSSQFWFAGKLARVSDVSLEQAVARQWPLIEQHAANLRPIELFPKRGVLEIWTAPGDSELDVAYYRPEIIFEKHSRPEAIDKTIKNNLIGFQGEMYEGGERGFSTLRTDDGRPLKAELKTAAELQAEGVAESIGPSDEEMQQLKKALEGKDINEVYEQQQERLRNQQT